MQWAWTFTFLKIIQALTLWITFNNIRRKMQENRSRIWQLWIKTIHHPFLSANYRILLWISPSKISDAWFKLIITHLQFRLFRISTVLNKWISEYAINTIPICDAIFNASSWRFTLSFAWVFFVSFSADTKSRETSC